jgi:HlyD family secretion protein
VGASLARGPARRALVLARSALTPTLSRGREGGTEGPLSSQREGGTEGPLSSQRLGGTEGPLSSQRLGGTEGPLSSQRLGRSEGLLALLVAVLAFGSCHRRDTEEAAAPRRRAVRCAVARAASLTDAIELRGTISPLPDKDAQVAPQVAGRLLRVRVREGDPVTVGQPLALIDDAPLAEDVRAAEANLGKTRAELKNARATLARVERVFEHGIAARQEVDDATARADTAAASQSEAESTWRRARRQVERATVRSPLGGVVVRIFRKPGELVDGTPATPVVEVADPGRLELTADATAGDLVHVHTGLAATVTIAALPGAVWTGQVSAVSPAVDRATGLGVVRVALDLADRVRPPIGVLGTARIATHAPRAAVVVPKEAVRSGPGGELEVVLCGADGMAHVRRLPAAGDPAAAGAGTVEALGLERGQAVAVDPVLGIVDGEAIEISR